MSIGFILAALFVLSLIIFGYQIQTINGINQTLVSDPASPLGELNETLTENLGGTYGSTTAVGESFDGQTQTIGEGDETLGIGIFSQLRSLKNIVFGSWNVFAVGIRNIFGIPPLVTNIIGGMLVVIMLLLGWRVIKAGGT